jgi:molybdopterin molybdotransferase
VQPLLAKLGATAASDDARARRAYAAEEITGPSRLPARRAATQSGRKLVVESTGHQGRTSSALSVSATVLSFSNASAAPLKRANGLKSPLIHLFGGCNGG